MAVRQKRLKGATYRDAMEAVLDLIPPELRPIAKGVPGMRNILVHGYADVYLLYMKSVQKLDWLSKREFLTVHPIQTRSCLEVPWLRARLKPADRLTGGPPGIERP